MNRRLAIRQWQEFVGQLKVHGIEVRVIPPVPECPGLVYPANAGIVRDGIFYSANLIPARAGEKKYYESFFSRLGFSVKSFGGGTVRFEGEADFFPWGDRMVFTHGCIERQRIVPSRRFPFYRRVYGFRSEASALEELHSIVPGRQILPIKLADERYYHGDTCLCSFGPRREFLLAYLPALHPESRQALLGLAQDRLIPLSDEDAACYAANAYAVTPAGSAPPAPQVPASLTPAGTPHLFMTVTASSALKSRIASLGVKVVEVDVSEFLKKGGGSVKCMVFDLSCN